MASAKPMDLLMVDNSSGFNAVNYSPLAMSDECTSVRTVVPGVHPRSLKAIPSAIGKLYGRMGTGDYVCTGSVIVSENGDTLLTSGHCVYDTRSSVWASDIIFVPAYSNGSSPYGRWAWRTVAAMTGWTQEEDLNYDVAVVLLAPSSDGQHIQDLTGSLGMSRNKERQAHTYAYGYPMNIHSGEELASCSNVSTPVNITYFHNFQGLRLPCNMADGAGAGPWTQTGDYQTSVSSFRIAGEKDVIYGPYFGDAIWNFWNQYQDQVDQ
jgi:hypothetical protein